MTPKHDNLLVPNLGLSDAQRNEVASILQASLADWITLALQLKQAHWNLTGRLFRAVHEQLDGINADVRQYSDDLAERIVTLGVAASGQCADVAESNRLKPLTNGRLDAVQFIEELVDNMDHATRSARETLPTLGKHDPVSEDLTIGALANLEKHTWMLRSLLAS